LLVGAPRAARSAVDAFQPFRCALKHDTNVSGKPMLMRIENVPFTAIDWSEIAPTEHAGTTHDARGALA
jgi:hypothetical protein